MFRLLQHLCKIYGKQHEKVRKTRSDFASGLFLSEKNGSAFWMIAISKKMSYNTIYMSIFDKMPE